MALGDRLRVVYVDDVLDPRAPGRSGMSDVVWDMAVALESLGHEAHIVGSYETCRFPEPIANVHNLAAPPFAYRNPIGHALRTISTARLIRRIRPQIVHGRDYFSTALLTYLCPSVPVVLTTPGNIFARVASGRNPYEGYYTEILKWSARRSAIACAAVIATSGKMEDWWRSTGVPSTRLERIPLGVSRSRFTHVPDARLRLGIAQEEVVLLYVGRFSPEKGILEFLSAVSGVSRTVDASRLRVTLVGTGPQADAIRQTVADLGIGNVVQLLPWVNQDELPVYYSSADALVLPSYSEPFGKVMIEAMACGTPVIASETEGPLDHVRQGINGYLFKVGDTAELAALLTGVVRSPDDLRAMRGQVADSVAHLGWHSVMAEIVSTVYSRIASDQTWRARHARPAGPSLR